ncbi:DUF1579 domain-containing protein [Dyadobacter luticola]|uniref:DUF1579 domain-containing protein n=1 Tax=Dyadobacter luticola TaxID=1979387 RepID=A0A5R9KWR6_9BACT|nr:DUF1579 domain-containing protein [Dyadobacter luticola]TLV00694.1 DUF1579 domain-containing protein [Dyadobacter luticola]
MSKSKFEISLESGVHRQLQSFTGTWEGTTKTWFEPDVVADESPMTGTIKSILGGRFIQYEYQGSLNGEAFEGIATFGFDIANNKFQCAWVDSFHMGTGILFSESAFSENGFSVLGSYGSPDFPEPWGWRTTLELRNPDELVITAYNIEPGGEDQIATETVYKRVG